MITAPSVAVPYLCLFNLSLGQNNPKQLIFPNFLPYFEEKQNKTIGRIKTLCEFPLN